MKNLTRCYRGMFWQTENKTYNNNQHYVVQLTMAFFQNVNEHKYQWYIRKPNFALPVKIQYNIHSFIHVRFRYRNNSKFTGGSKHKLYTTITFHNKDMKKNHVIWILQYYFFQASHYILTNCVCFQPQILNCFCIPFCMQGIAFLFLCYSVFLI